MAFNIRVKHPLYEDYIDVWTLMRDCAEGEDDIKSKGTTYLPMKSGMAAISNELKRTAAYSAYMMRAEFPELVSPTIRGSVGLVHEQEATVELPQAMEYLRERATQEGLTLAGLHRRITTEILTTGRYGLLPGVGRDRNIYLSGYTAESMINWDEDDAQQLSYAVLDESGPIRNPETNVWSEQEQYLECKLEEGRYVATRWTRSSGGFDTEELDVAQTPRREPLQSIPLVFIDTMDLTPEPDDVPLYGLARLCLRVYRLDADYVHGLHMTSEPTPYVTGFTDPKKAVEDGTAPTTIGAAKIWILPKDATANFLEFTGPGLEAQEKAITNALHRAAMFGAQVLSDENRAQESGDSRRLRLRSQHSTLKTIAQTSAAGLEKALRNIAIWKGLDPMQVTVKPFLDFIDRTLTSQELTALVAGWQSGAYSKMTLFENLQRADMISQDRTFEEEEEMIGDEAGGLGSLGGAGERGDPGSEQIPQDDPDGE